MKQQYNMPRPLMLMLLALVCVVAFFANNEVIVPDIMESRNIITAREMVDDGNWLVPTMNGDLRLEKPPLPTWLTALAESASPDNLFLQRAMAGLAALLLVYFFWKLASRVLRIDPLAPTLLLCTCYNVILMGRTASWDIYCHAFMMGGIYFLARGLLDRERRRVWADFLWAGLFTGLSIMSKGPVSPYALFLPFLIAFIWVYRPQAKGKGWPIAAMVALALVVGAWWFVYVHFAVGDRMAEVVQKESANWANHNVRPWWYYWKFFLETGVWSLLLLTSIFLPLFSEKRRKSRSWLFSMIWMLASLVLLSLMPEKKTRYLLPLLIPSAYVMGSMVIWWVKGFGRRDGAAPERGDKLMFRINAGLVALAVAALPVVGWQMLVAPGWLSVPVWGVLTAVCAAVAAWLVCSIVRLKPMGLLWSVTLLFAAAELLVMPSLGKIINNPDRHSIAAVRDMPELEGAQFMYIDSVPLRIELVYAAHRTILPVAPDSLPGAVKPPFVLLTRSHIGDELPDAARRIVESGLDTLHIDRFDDNRRPAGSKRYSPQFIYHATLISAKSSDTENTTENE